MAPDMRERTSRILLDSYYLVSGGGGRWLEHKAEYHRRRQDMERAFLAEARVHPEHLRARACPACGKSQTSRQFTNPVGFSFDVCADDGTIYMNPAPTEAALGRLYNDPAESFKHLGNSEDGAVRPSNQEDFDALIRLAPQSVRGGALLDVGCAKGAFLLTARSAFSVSGVELNATTAEVARRQGFQITAGRVADVPGAGTYAVITMLQLIEHIADVTDFLTDVRRLLADDGVLYVSTPAIDSASFDYLGSKHIHVASFGHVSLFSRAAFSVLAERCGFDLIAHEYWGGLDLSLADVAVHEIAPSRFSHRMAAYSPRLYYAGDIIEQLGAGGLRWRFAKPGAESYQRVLLKKKR